MDFKNLNNYLNYNNFDNKTEDDYKIKPKLVHNSTKIFFNKILNNCNTLKKNNYNLFYNIGMFLVLVTIIFIILYSKYKGNMTPQQRYEKNTKDKQYIMSKLVYYNRQNLENNQKIRNNMITNLPDYSNHPEASALHKNVYFT